MEELDRLKRFDILTRYNASYNSSTPVATCAAPNGVKATRPWRKDVNETTTSKEQPRRHAINGPGGASGEFHWSPLTCCT